jgi:hypothetical protein
MKSNPYEQMNPKKRAYMLIDKYPMWYVKDSVNGIITTSRDNNETEICNYWNEVAIEVKSLIKQYNL